jgi:proliferating cell nuclear antigen
MELELKEIDLFKRIIDALSSLMSDVSLDLTKEGLSIKAMDPANVAMILFSGKPGMFEQFNLDKDTKLSVSLLDLVNVFKLVKRGEKVKLTDIKNRLIIDVVGKTKRKFSIPLIDENYTAQKVPQLKFSAEGTILSQIMRDGIKGAVLVDDSIYISVSRDKLMMSAKSDDKEFVEDISINENKDIFDLRAEDADTKSKYSIDYLSKFLDAVDPEKPLKFYIAKNYPLKIDYELDSNASVSFILANRIE